MRYLYAVFSATPYKIGKFIRDMTGNRFNHVSVSLDPALAHMYTFARIHRNTPFFGGFIVESFRRFEYHGISSTFRVCRIPVTEERYAEVSALLAAMYRRRGQYLYNLYSALFTPLRIRLHIRNSYTCAEFAGDIFSIAGVKIPFGAFHSIDEMAEQLRKYAIYEGDSAGYSGLFSWGDDHFSDEPNVVVGACKTAVMIGELTARGVCGAVAHSFEKRE